MTNEVKSLVREIFAEDNLQTIDVLINGTSQEPLTADEYADLKVQIENYKNYIRQQYAKRRRAKEKNNDR